MSNRNQRDGGGDTRCLTNPSRGFLHFALPTIENPAPSRMTGIYNITVYFGMGKMSNFEIGKIPMLIIPLLPFQQRDI
jgi:hypothetical protein